MCPASRSEAGRLASTAALLSLLLTAGLPRPVLAQDEWFSPDKLLHFLGGFFVTTATYTIVAYRTDRGHEDARRIAFAAGITASIAKELYDGLSGKGTPSGKDLVWDGIGIGFSMALINQMGVTRQAPYIREPTIGAALWPRTTLLLPSRTGQEGARGIWLRTGFAPNRIDTPTLPLSLTFLPARPPGD